MALQIILLHINLNKKELKSCVQSFSFFHQMIASKSDPHLSKQICVSCLTESPLKMIKKCFLFQLKSSFRSQDI